MSSPTHRERLFQRSNNQVYEVFALRRHHLLVAGRRQYGPGLLRSQLVARKRPHLPFQVQAVAAMLNHSRNHASSGAGLPVLAEGVVIHKSSGDIVTDVPGPSSSKAVRFRSRLPSHAGARRRVHDFGMGHVDAVLLDRRCLQRCPIAVRRNAGQLDDLRPIHQCSRRRYIVIGTRSGFNPGRRHTPHLAERRPRPSGLHLLGDDAVRACLCRSCSRRVMEVKSRMGACSTLLC